MRHYWLVAIDTGATSFGSINEALAEAVSVPTQNVAGPFQLDAGAVEFLRAANGKKLPAPALRVMKGLAKQWAPLAGMDVWNLTHVGRERDPEEW